MVISTYGGRRRAGSPSDLVRWLWEMDHGRARDVDAYIARVAADLHFVIVGDTLDARCESFLAEAAKAGWIRLDKDAAT